MAGAAQLALQIYISRRVFSFFKSTTPLTSQVELRGAVLILKAVRDETVYGTLRTQDSLGVISEGTMGHALPTDLARRRALTPPHTHIPPTHKHIRAGFPGPGPYARSQGRSTLSFCICMLTVLCTPPDLPIPPPHTLPHTHTSGFPDPYARSLVCAGSGPPLFS